MSKAPPASAPNASATLLTQAHAHRLLHQMLRIRRFEEKCAEEYSRGRIRGFLHLYVGEEAIAVGALDVLTPDDAVLCTYREHGHALARGLPMNEVMAEMFGKVEGSSKGRGGSMHIFDTDARFYGGNAIVAGHLPLAVGLGLADSYEGRPRVTACFFGEGAAAEGEFHESLNLASLWKLPVVFCCENNFYAMGTALERSESEVHIAKKAESYGVSAEVVDGMDVLAVRDAMRRAAASARAGEGPQLLELQTYRFRAHSMFDAELYRDKAEVEAWRARDPIATFSAMLRRDGLLEDGALEAMQANVEEEVGAAVAFAEAGRWEPVEQLLTDVMTPRSSGRAPLPSWRPEEVEAWEGPRTVTCCEAMRLATREAMHSDPRVFLVGEDVGAYGGSYAVSRDLLAELGPERIRDAPLSESGFTGAGIGAALGGLRPIVEIMTVNFSLLALDQILNNAATLRHMSGGQISVPLVIRMATGAGKQLAAQHSHSLEGWYAHIPGLRVVAPATVEDFRGMLWTALTDPDPVLIFENALLYNLEGELRPDLGPVDLDRAAVRREGSDVTLITYGGSLHKTLEAATVLQEAHGVSAEVIDLRSLRPLDMPTVLRSVRKTQRGVVVDEGWRTGSLSAEIITSIQEAAFYDLDAPLQRVCTEEVPIPYPRHLEQAAIPQPGRIVAAALLTLGRTEGARLGDRHDG